MSNTHRIFAGVTAIMTIVVACHHQPDIIEPNPNGNGNIPDTIIVINPDPCSPDTAYYQNTILPLVNSNCAMSGCHDSNGTGEADPYTTYSQIRSNRNDMLEQMQQGTMPPQSSGITLTADQIAQFQLWIQQGAQYNSCQEDCDSTQGSFATNVLPLMTQFCVGCHGSNSPSLETYAEISDAAANPSFMNALHGINGAAIMPQNTTGLPDCYIQQIQNWIDAGRLNN